VHSRLLSRERRLPFRKFNLTPEQIEPLRKAFGKVCQALALNWQPEDPATDLIATKILEASGLPVS
jgi:hypothetical protein